MRSQFPGHGRAFGFRRDGHRVHHGFRRPATGSQRQRLLRRATTPGRGDRLGKNHRPFGEPKPNSEVRDFTAFGVLKLTLRASGYDWQFIPEEGKTFTDSGSGACH